MKKSLLLIIVFLVNISSISLNAQNDGVYSVKGKVTEKQTSSTMEYCTVSLHDSRDSSLINGVVTDLNGIFNIPTNKTGLFYIKVSFIGFETKTISNIILNSNTPIHKVDNVRLETNSNLVNEVEVNATRSTIRYEIDKKIISVGKNIVSESGSAVDILESTPSVQVEADGTVKLRGSSSFMVLIDGKPTVLSGSEALRQIPAINIKNIELITNPSAKYDAGTSGIINIILKNNKKLETSGLLSLSLGTFNNYRANVNIKHNVKKFTFDFSARVRNNAGPVNALDSIYTSTDDKIYTLKKGDNAWTFGGYNFNYGVAYKIDSNHSVNFDMVLGKWYMYADDNANLYQKNITKNKIHESKTINDTYRGAPFFGPSLSYSGDFKNKSNLTLYIGYSQSDFSEEVINDNYTVNEILLDGTKTTDFGKNNRLTSKIDFTLPIKKGRLEIGAKANNLISVTNSRAYDLDLPNNIYLEKDYNNSEIKFTRNIYGFYTTYANKYKKITYNGGLRAEYTDRILKTDAENLVYSKWNLFPTLHLGYSFNDKHQIYASYSSMINRPPAWQIEPQIIQTSVNTYFQGDENLTSNIVNSLVLGWEKSFKKETRLSFEAYYYLYNDYVEFVTRPYTNGTTLAKPINAGEVHNMGLEGNYSKKLFSWWSFDLSGNGFVSIFNVDVKEIKTTRTTFEWSNRLNNFFNITKTTKLQFSGRYNSRQSTTLGYAGDWYYFDLGLKKSFLKRKLNLSLNFRNIFNTRDNTSISSTENYYSNYYNKPKWPRITVGVSYKINNFRKSWRQNESNQGQI